MVAGDGKDADGTSAVRVSVKFAGAKTQRAGRGFAPNSKYGFFSSLVNHVIILVYCRYLVVDDIWIPLGESLLIEKLQPLWNITLDGFGNHDPGGGRYKQQRSPWDVMHPGRDWAAKCSENRQSKESITAAVTHFLSSRKPSK